MRTLLILAVPPRALGGGCDATRADAPAAGEGSLHRPGRIEPAS